MPLLDTFKEDVRVPWSHIMVATLHLNL